jgi:S-adenosylmethionine-dependent methyltransferase
VSTTFSAGEQEWRARLGTLRQVVRQEMVARQLAEQLPDQPALRVLDIGCGQGTLLLRLARCGHELTGLDSSEALLDDLGRSLRAEPPEVAARVRLVRGDALSAPELPGMAGFDAVLCQGVLMYFADPDPLLAAIAAVTAPGGVVSLLVRNGDALAMRPGLQGDWAGAAAGFDGAAYTNRIGVRARADRLADLTAALERHGLRVRCWYGVRLFTDLAADDAPVPGGDELARLLDCEERAGRTDPYRAVAALLHVIAYRS